MQRNVRPIRRAAVAIAGVIASVLVLTAAPASALGEVTTWSPSGCGSVQTTVVPARVYEMTVTIAGGKGGKGGGQSSGTTGSGGQGSRVTATFPVQPGDTISGILGCNGNNGPESGSTPGAAGWAPGGGTGQGQNTAFDTSGAGGGGGGGASAVCAGTVCVAGSGTPLVVAGGAGGSGSSNCSGTTGGDGGNGGAGSSTSAGSGAGPSGANGGNGANTGAQTSSIPGGAGGVNSTGGSSTGGSSPNGSGGLQVNVVGGGGGGGYVGGRAGANANTACKAGGAGGGGSSWVRSTATSSSFATASTASLVITFTSVWTAPSAPTVTGALATNGQAIVAWTAPTDDGGTPVTGYVVTAYSGATAVTSQTFGPTATNGWITGLTNGTPYTLTVAATNAVGTGAESAPSAAVTPAAPPSSVGSPTARPGDTTALVTWTAPASDGGDPIDGYLITPIRDNVAQPGITFPGAALSQTVTGLTNGSTYRFRIQAYNGAGFAQSIGTANIIVGSPLPPTGVAAVPGDGSATVRWTPPAADNGAPITSYRVTPFEGTTALTPRFFSPGATSGTITGLTNGTTYTFRVAAVNARGAGPTSASSAIVVGTPAPPRVTATAVGSTGIDVSWTVPSASGSPLLGYLVVLVVDGVVASSQTVPTSVTSLALRTLPAGSYVLRVSGYNARGTGPAGSSATVVLLGAG